MSYELTDFQADIIDASMALPVVVDFWAPWCGPCTTLGPILEKMAGEAKGRWRLVKVNVDEHQDVAMSFQVQSIPAVFLVHQGQVLDGFAGALPESQVRAWLEPHLGEAGEEAPEEEVPADAGGVDALLAAGNEDAAVAAQRTLLEEEPDNLDAKVKLATMLLFTAPAESLELLHGFDATHKAFDRAEKLAMLAENLAQDPEAAPAHPHARGYYLDALTALKAKNFEAAVEAFLDVLYRDKTYHEGAARKGMIGIFEYLGRDHALTKAYQRRFEMAMF